MLNMRFCHSSTSHVASLDKVRNPASSFLMFVASFLLQGSLRCLDRTDGQHSFVIEFGPWIHYV